MTDRMKLIASVFSNPTFLDFVAVIAFILILVAAIKVARNLITTEDVEDDEQYY
jgi:hypothetical protein